MSIDIPGYQSGTWTIDAVHSDVSFTIRHLMVSKVRGNFRAFEGTIVTGEKPEDSSVTAVIDLKSIDTGQAQRDEHIRSADFFEVEKHPTMTYRSTGVRADGKDFVLDGELTLKGITKEVPLKLEANGFGADPYGGTRAGFSAKTEINRTDFDVTFNSALDNGGVMLGEKVQITLEIEAVLSKPEA